MAKPALDQAEGLRRMFAGDVRRMIGVSSDCTSVSGCALAAKLATTLGAAGSRVLLLDESLVAGEMHPIFKVSASCDMFQVLSGKADMSLALTSVAPNVDLLAGGVAHVARGLDTKSQTNFANILYQLAGAYDVVLINAAESSAKYCPSLTWAAQDIIVLCGERTDSVTAAYARIKALRLAGERRFHMLFEAMPAERAQMLYRNLATVSRRHLREMPTDLGVLPQDATDLFFEVLADSVQAWPMPEHKDGHFQVFMQRLLQEPVDHRQVAAARSN